MSTTESKKTTSPKHSKKDKKNDEEISPDKIEVEEVCMFSFCSSIFFEKVHNLSIFQSRTVSNLKLVTHSGSYSKQLGKC